MGMKEMPAVEKLADGGVFWKHEYKNFKVKTYVPKSAPITEIVNFGFKAPYLIVFEENELTDNEAVSFAKETKLEEIAANYGSSVVFVSPTSEKGWEDASYDLFPELIAESKINQYYQSGVANMKNRFTGEWGENFIRGAIFRSYLYGFGKSADFIAANYLRKVDGEFLWGPGDITPAACILNGLSGIPKVYREDIPVVSVGNSEEINNALKLSCDRLLVKDKPDYVADFKDFICRKRRWCGHLEDEPVFSEIGMVEETSFETVTTSKDNLGDDAGTKEHKIGYVAYYNKDLFDRGPAPMLLAFHGGGDSSFYITHVSGWWEVAKKHNFLLIAIENHLNSTATEMVELIDKLKAKYNIDEKRIYGSGFSMGGCKSWDCMQEYPEVFAGLAPMDATFEVGLNVYGKPARCEINRKTAVPLFYAGGEITPLPELPFQAEKCHDRMKYVFETNDLKKEYNVKYEDRENWANPIWGISGDRTEKFYDVTRDACLTVEYFDSKDGVCRTAFGSISGQGHECRRHTCEKAWEFISKFSR